jgi:hypothetical protein
MKQIYLSLRLALLLFLLLTLPAFAQEPGGGRVIFGNNFTLNAEETVGDSLVVFGGNVTTKNSSTIKGDLVVFGGNAEVGGQITGNIVVLGGNANLTETAVVNGDMVYMGGSATISEGARIEGDVVNPFGPEGFKTEFGRYPGEDSTVPPVPPVPPIPSVQVESGFSSVAHRAISAIEELVWTITVLIALVAVSWLVAAFMPEQMGVVGETIIKSAPLSFGVGFLTTVVSIIVGIPLLITICLAFAPILAWLVMGIAMLFGWLVIGQLVGERLLEATGRAYPNFITSTVVGTLVLTVVVKMPVLSWIPCLGFIFGLVGGLLGLVVGLTGLGAVILTRFGTRPYIRPASGPGGGRPGPASYPGGPYTAADVADVDVNPASEAELKARIAEVLAEADRLKKQVKEKLPAEPQPEPSTPDDEPDQNPR